MASPRNNEDKTFLSKPARILQSEDSLKIKVGDYLDHVVGISGDYINAAAEIMRSISHKINHDEVLYLARVLPSRERGRSTQTAPCALLLRVKFDPHLERHEMGMSPILMSFLRYKPHDKILGFCLEIMDANKVPDMQAATFEVIRITPEGSDSPPNKSKKYIFAKEKLNQLIQEQLKDQFICVGQLVKVNYKFNKEDITLILSLKLHQLDYKNMADEKMDISCYDSELEGMVFKINNKTNLMYEEGNFGVDTQFEVLEQKETITNYTPYTYHSRLTFNSGDQYRKYHETLFSSQLFNLDGLEPVQSDSSEKPTDQSDPTHVSGLTGQLGLFNLGNFAVPFPSSQPDHKEDANNENLENKKSNSP